MRQAAMKDGVRAAEDAADWTRSEEVSTLHRHCGVYTKPSVVRRILDAVGWRDDTDLSRARLLEPAAGNGEFVVEAARRLIISCRRAGVNTSISNLSHCIRAFEVYRDAAEEARARIRKTLCSLGLHDQTAAACAGCWVVNDDFLLVDPPREGFTHVVGNPPYIRWSKIPSNLKTAYADRLPPGMTGGDLFLPFLDRALDQLIASGRCGFLCSDRWRFMAFAETFRNKWLPALDIASEDSVLAGEAFVADVNVYPTILIASKRPRRKPMPPKPAFRQVKTLGESGHAVKVGPALGHTPAFVLQPYEDDVEPELLVPWIDSSEIGDGSVAWRGRRVIVMYRDDGKLVDLERFPLLAQRLGRFADKLKQRSIVRNGAVWYKTIDRVRAADWLRPKLLVPELAKVPRLAIDKSGAIPSHGVYSIFASDDDVEALYEKLSDGKLAQALRGISPKVRGEYWRCYKRFLSTIPLAD